MGYQGHGDYTWGFRIFRTTYKQPDVKFTEAIGILNEYIRYECFSYTDDGRHRGTIPHPPLDVKANDQLWQRLNNEVVEDGELLENATPDKILSLAQAWAHCDRKARTADDPRYRFFLVIDDEVIEHLLQLPTPATYANTKLSIPMVYSVKVYDARFNSPPQFSGGESDSDSEADDEYEEDDGFEGWFWTSARKLMQLWFCDYQAGEELLAIDDSWDGVKRFVPGMVALDYGLPLASTRPSYYTASMKAEEAADSA